MKKGGRREEGWLEGRRDGWMRGRRDQGMEGYMESTIVQYSSLNNIRLKLNKIKIIKILYESSTWLYLNSASETRFPPTRNRLDILRDFLKNDFLKSIFKNLSQIVKIF